MTTLTKAVRTRTTTRWVLSFARLRFSNARLHAAWRALGAWMQLCDTKSISFSANNWLCSFGRVKAKDAEDDENMSGSGEEDEGDVRWPAVLRPVFATDSLTQRLTGRGGGAAAAQSSAQTRDPRQTVGFPGLAMLAALSIDSSAASTA